MRFDRKRIGYGENVKVGWGVARRPYHFQESQQVQFLIVSLIFILIPLCIAHKLFDLRHTPFQTALNIFVFQGCDPLASPFSSIP